MLTCDNLAWSPVPWTTAGADVLGEVVWVSGVPMAA